MCLKYQESDAGTADQFVKTKFSLLANCRSELYHGIALLIYNFALTWLSYFIQIYVRCCLKCFCLK